MGKIKIDWDGVASYKSETSRDSGSMLSNLMQGGEPEEIDLREAMNLKFNAISSGQNVAYFINKLQALQVPDISKRGYTNGNDVWQNYGKLLSDYVKPLPRNGKPTLLMDEPDKSLDYKSQNVFWDKIVDILSQKWQMIIVTHSVFALARTKDNIIDQDDYFSISNKLINKVFRPQE